MPSPLSIGTHGTHPPRAGAPFRRIWLSSALLLLLLGGCADMSYYWQAARGQWEIIRARQPIGEVLTDPAVPEPVKAGLRTVQDAQRFGAAALALAPKVHYTSYADLGRPQVSWLVVSAEAFALKARQECFLFVGCFGYRGFFAREDADAYADRRAAEGYDVLVRSVTAYSTLGWFEDPLLNTMLDEEPAWLVTTVYHEQAHRMVFVKGDTTFNESLATFVAQEGVRRYLHSQGAAGAQALRRYEAQEADRKRFRAILLAGRKRLEAVYAGAAPPAEMRRRKAEAFAALRSDYASQRASFKILSYDGWFSQPLNNAHLVGVGQYHDRVTAFAALFAREGQDFARFFAAADKLGELPAEQRQAALDALSADAPEESLTSRP